MKLINILIFSILIVISGTVMAEDKSIFVGYDSDNKKRYVVWNGFDHGLAKIAHSASGPKEISKHMVSCINNMFWS